MASERFSTAIGPMRGDQNRLVRLLSIEGSTPQNLGIQVLNRGAEKESRRLNRRGLSPLPNESTRR
jgi:hypothetical protein